MNHQDTKGNKNDKIFLFSKFKLLKPDNSKQDSIKFLFIFLDALGVLVVKALSFMVWSRWLFPARGLSAPTPDKNKRFCGKARVSIQNHEKNRSIGPGADPSGFPACYAIYPFPP